MTLVDRAALNVNIPAYTPEDPDAARPRTNANDPNRRRKEQIDAIKEQFRLAITYDKGA